jgi:hypothetical protein
MVIPIPTDYQKKDVEDFNHFDYLINDRVNFSLSRLSEY